MGFETKLPPNHATDKLYSQKDTQILRDTIVILIEVG